MSLARKSVPYGPPFSLTFYHELKNGGRYSPDKTEKIGPSLSFFLLIFAGVRGIDCHFAKVEWSKGEKGESVMSMFFLLCAIFGGTILLIQVALALFGFGADVDLPDADVGGDVGGDVGDSGHLAEVGHGGMVYLAKVVTFQTVVAFLAFFGIGGMVGLELGLRVGGTILLAAGAGVSAMLLTAYCFSWLRALQGEGTVQIRNAGGATGVVYLRVPGQDDGIGKVTIVLQGRTVELAARTPGPELRTGEKVVVSRVIDDRTVEVVAEAAYLAKEVSLND